MTLLEKRAVKITELSEELVEAKSIISAFVWPADLTEEQRRKFLIRSAKFAGCSVPQFSDDQEKSDGAS